MLDSPLLLVAIGMSALSAAVLARWRRKRSTALATLTDAQLRALLPAVQEGSADIETRRKVTLLVVEELERRRA